MPSRSGSSLSPGPADSESAAKANSRKQPLAGHLPQRGYALLCLLFAAVVFYGSYGFANWYTAGRGDVPELVFAWEQYIPFVPYSILPYWSLNFAYALGFFLCRGRRELHRYLAQLLGAQLVAITCFLLFPLQYSQVKPSIDGVAGWLFSSLALFDQPYNQAPSLHVMLALIVGRFYWLRSPAKWRIAVALYFLCVGISVLTTWQHHFIDVPTGVLAGALVLWALPEQHLPRRTPVGFLSTAHCKWALLYALFALCWIALAALGGAWLWCLWAAVSCISMSLCYAVFGPRAMQKEENGRLSMAAFLLLLPYLLAVRANMAYWLRGSARKSVILEKRIHIGSILAARSYHAVVDVCAEYPLYCPPAHYGVVPLLDMVPPARDDLGRAADMLQDMLLSGRTPVLVCCALGYGRSIAVVLAWMLRYGGDTDLEMAAAKLRRICPQMVLPQATRVQILRLAEQRPCPDSNTEKKDTVTSQRI